MTEPIVSVSELAYRPLTVRAQEGTLFHATYPAATFTLWSQIVAFELLHKALAQGVGTIPASSGGDEPGFMVVGFDPRTGRDFVISNNEGIGWGAGCDHDGANAQQHLSQSVVRNTPVEVLEQRAPLLHHRVELVTDSGGAGRYRGGVGVRREVELLAPCEVLSMKKKSKVSPRALAGGRDPLTRVPGLVLADVREGYISPGQARDIYGVEVGSDGSWTPTPARMSAQEGNRS